MKYINESQSILVVGRKNYKPGEELPAPKNQTEKYQKDFQKFLDLGLIKQEGSKAKASTSTSTKAPKASKKETATTTKKEDTTNEVQSEDKKQEQAPSGNW